MNPDRGSVINMCLEGGHNATEQEITKWMAMNWHDAYYDIKKYYPTSIDESSVINVCLDRGITASDEDKKLAGGTWHNAWYTLKDKYPPNSIQPSVSDPSSTVLQPGHYEVKG